MDKSEGPRSPTVEEASGGGPLDMDFIKSFLDNDEQEETPKSGSLLEGEEVGNKEEKDKTQEPMAHKRKKRKKKVMKRAINGKPPPSAPKQDTQVPEDDQKTEEDDSKQEQRRVKPVPKPRKSLQRPASAPRQRFHNRPSSAPRQRQKFEPLLNTDASKEVDSDLDSIEQVERQNVTQGILVRRQRLKSAKPRNRPQSASKYESIKRADELSNEEPEYQLGGEMRVTFDKATKDTENVALKKDKFRSTAESSYLSRTTKYEFRDYHSKPLQQKYKELHELRSKKYHQTKVRDRDNPEVVTFAKGMLRKYGVKVADPVSFQTHQLINPAEQQPTTPNTYSATPPHRAADRPFRTYGHHHKGVRQRRCAGSKSPSRDKNDPVIIDVSQEVDTKHVKFAGEGESVDSTSLDQDSEDILTVEREIALQSLHNSEASSSSGKPRGRKAHNASTTTKTKLSRSKTPGSANSSLSRSDSASPPRSGGRFWSSDTSESDSPPRSPVRGVPTDCDLRNTGSTKIQQWLKKKNREIRKQKRQERKKIRQEMKEQDEEYKEKEEKQEASDKKVAAWMKLKKKETRLLRRKQSNTNVLQITKSNSNFKFGGKVQVMEEVTVGHVENRENMVADGKEKEEKDVSCQGAGKDGQLGVKGRALSQKRPACAKVTTTSVVDVNMKGQESTASCTCGYAEVQRLKEEELKQARLAAKKRALEAQRARQAEKAKRELLKPTTAQVAFSEDSQSDKTPTPKASANLPEISKSQGLRGKKFTNKDGGKKDVESTNQSQEEKLKQQKQSYDNWLKKKREENRKKQQEERRKKEELASSVDEEDKEVMHKVARKRIDNILKQKKRIDSGVEQIDAAANASVEERIEAKKSAAKAKGTKDTSNVNKPADVDNAENSGIFLTEEPKEPEAPKYVLPESEKDSSDGKTNQAKGKQRPSSARPASAKTKPKRSRPISAKADFNRPASRADKVTNNHQNPFKLPQPPPPKRNSPSPPRPKVRTTPAYKNVKYQQQSWEEFSEFVWDKVNQDVEDEYQQNHERPEPMGADNPDEVIQPVSQVTDKTASEKTDPGDEVIQVPEVTSQESHPDDHDHTPDDSPRVQNSMPESAADIPGEGDEGENPEEKEKTETITTEDNEQEDTFGDDFEEKDEKMTIPRIDIKSPSPEAQEAAVEAVAKETAENETAEKNMDDDGNPGVWNEEDVTLWKEINKQFTEEQQQRQAIISDRLQETDGVSMETPDKDEVDNVPAPSSVGSEPVVSKKNKKSEKSVRFSEEVETQEFVYEEEEEDEYDTPYDQGNIAAGYAMRNEMVQFDIPLPVASSSNAEESEDQSGKEEGKEPAETNEMGEESAVSFLMKGIMDSASQNVSSLNSKLKTD